MFRSTHARLVRPDACFVADSLSCSVLCNIGRPFTAGLPNIADPTWASPELICQRRSVRGRDWEYAAPFLLKEGQSASFVCVTGVVASRRLLRFHGLTALG